MSKPGWKTGRIYSVPCTECNKRHDLTPMEEMLTDQWSGEGVASDGTDKQWFICDNPDCKAKLEIVKVERTILVSVRRM